jgi:hypothetical protein
MNNGQGLPTGDLTLPFEALAAAGKDEGENC